MNILGEKFYTMQGDCEPIIFSEFDVEQVLVQPFEMVIICEDTLEVEAEINGTLCVVVLTDGTLVATNPELAHDKVIEVANELASLCRIAQSSRWN